MKSKFSNIILVSTTFIAALFLISSSSCTWLNESLSRKNYRSPIAKNFWNWFSENKSRMAEIREEDDPRLQEIREKLRSIDPKLDFKIGYTTEEFRAIGAKDNCWVQCRGKQKKHLLSVTCVQCDRRACYLAQTLVHDAEFPGIERKCHYYYPNFVQLDSNWCATLGYHPFSDNKRSYSFSGKGETITIDPKKVRYRAHFNRNSNLVDVTLCSDTAFGEHQGTINGDSLLSESINDGLEKWLGTFDYVNSLGDVSVESNCEDSEHVWLMHNEFNRLRPRKYTNWFNKKLVSDPSEKFRETPRFVHSWLLCPYRPSLDWY